MLSTNVDWVFFDLGDTLIDNNPVWDGMLEDLRASLSELGVIHSFSELATLFETISGEATPRPFNQLPGRLGLTEEQGRLATSRCVWRYDLETPIPGAKELLSALQGRYKLGVIANQALGSVERCTNWGITRYFDQFLTSAELGLSKPDPRIFHLALETAQCPPERAVMIGDRIDNDIRPARMVGMKTIRLARGYQRLQQPRDEWDTPDFTAETLEEVRGLLLE